MIMTAYVISCLLFAIALTLSNKKIARRFNQFVNNNVRKIIDSKRS
jgi:hypothetical protein